MKLIASVLLFASAASYVPAAEFELKDGDKVVWLGSTLIEREQRYGYWETALTARWPDRKITFRNLGWSGDNVFGEARLSFDINNPALGLKRMVDLTLAEKPTVIIICYGTNESFEGEAGLEKFEKGYEKLLDELKPTKARIVLMTPPPFFLDAGESNKRLDLYCEAIQRIGKKRGLFVADLKDAFSNFLLAKPQQKKWTDNGMHLTEYGYYASTRAVATLLGINDLPSGLSFIEFLANAEPLRQAIVDKNKLYFYRWRPQNETYLFGFRKKEQGRNAKEIAQFDPLIARMEEEIDKLKKTNTPAPVRKK